MARRLSDLPNHRILLYDIECTSLQADFGVLLCVGWKWLGSKRVNVFKIDLSNTGKFQVEERKLLNRFLKVYNSADMVITYNGKLFDQKYIQAKAVHFSERTPQNPPHVDLYWTVKHNFKISRKSLQNAAYYFGLSNEKTPVEGQIWLRAAMGDKSALRYIVAHCRADVLVLEELYLKLRSYVRQHPRVKGYGPCAACGGVKFEFCRYAMTTKKGAFAKLRCLNCGYSEERPANKMGEGIKIYRTVK